VDEVNMITYRRILLDKDLEDAKQFMKGIVLDIGGGRRRGTFKEPLDVTWTVLDLEKRPPPILLILLEMQQNYLLSQIALTASNVPNY
jgi:hypothetical protein